MNDLISRADAIKDAESWGAVDDYEKHLQKNVVEWLKEFPSAEHSTNLAEVGKDAISRQSVIDMLDETKRIARQNIDGAVLMTFERVLDSLVNITNALPTIQPEIVRCEECLYRKICSWEKQGAKFCSFAERREATE